MSTSMMNLALTKPIKKKPKNKKLQKKNLQGQGYDPVWGREISQLDDSQQFNSIKHFQASPQLQNSHFNSNNQLDSRFITQQQQQQQQQQQIQQQSPPEKSKLNNQMQLNLNALPQSTILIDQSAKKERIGTTLNTMQLVSSTEPCIQEYMHTMVDSDADDYIQPAAADNLQSTLQNDNSIQSSGTNNQNPKPEQHLQNLNSNDQSNQQSLKCWHWLELTNRSEGFIPEPVSDQNIVHQIDILNKPSKNQGSSVVTNENGDILSEDNYVAVSLETQTLKQESASGGTKNISRIVLVNERGERLLDTLVKPQEENVPCKGGTKMALFKYAEGRADPLATIMRRVRQLTKGKFLVAYHLPMKVADLKLNLKDLGQVEVGSGMSHIDVAKLFSQNGEQQVPMSTLTENVLNLKYVKRPSPSYAFTEAKIAMALFKQYQLLRSNPKPLQQQSLTSGVVGQENVNGNKNEQADNQQNNEQVFKERNDIQATMDNNVNSDTFSYNSSSIAPVPEPEQLGQETTASASASASVQQVNNGKTLAEYEDQDVVVLDGMKLKALIREYAQEVVREELKLAYQRLANF